MVFRPRSGDLKKKKGLHQNFMFFRQNLVTSKKKVFTVTKANGLPEANGLLKLHGPRGNCPPLSAALFVWFSAYLSIQRVGCWQS